MLALCEMDLQYERVRESIERQSRRKFSNVELSRSWKMVNTIGGLSARLDIVVD